MSSLGNVLETIDEQNFRDSDLGCFFYDRIAHELADAFGIDRDFVHTMRNIGEGLKPTAIVQVNENKRPWAVFEVVPSYMEDRKKKAERMIKNTYIIRTPTSVWSSPRHTLSYLMQMVQFYTISIQRTEAK